MGRQVDLQAALQAMDQLRCELAETQQARESSKSGSTGKNVVLSSGFITALLAGGWGFMQDRALDEARSKQLQQDTQAHIETLVKRLETTDTRLKEVTALMRQQSIDNVALATHIAAKVDAVSSRARRVAKPLTVEAAETRAARFRIGD